MTYCEDEYHADDSAELAQRAREMFAYVPDDRYDEVDPISNLWPIAWSCHEAGQLPNSAMELLATQVDEACMESAEDFDYSEAAPASSRG